MNDYYENLLVLLKIFKNRPYHLTRYLINNNAFNDEFIIKVLNSKKLNELKNQVIDDRQFNSIDEMKDYYNSLINYIDNLDSEIYLRELLDELKIQLKIALENEDYEKAAEIRDYIKINKLNKK
jgi:hypothetical protein